MNGWTHSTDLRTPERVAPVGTEGNKAAMCAPRVDGRAKN